MYIPTLGPDPVPRRPPVSGPSRVSKEGPSSRDRDGPSSAGRDVLTDRVGTNVLRMDYFDAAVCEWKWWLAEFLKDPLVAAAARLRRWAVFHDDARMGPPGISVPGVGPEPEVDPKGGYGAL